MKLKIKILEHFTGDTVLASIFFNNSYAGTLTIKKKEYSKFCDILNQACTRGDINKVTFKEVKL